MLELQGRACTIRLMPKIPLAISEGGRGAHTMFGRPSWQVQPSGCRNFARLLRLRNMRTSHSIFSFTRGSPNIYNNRASGREVLHSYGLESALFPYFSAYIVVMQKNLTSKGQISIPAHIRNRPHLKLGDVLEMYENLTT